MAESRWRRLEARVYGRVQGVGFRQFVTRVAAGSGLVGFVRNDVSTGSVEVVAEGPVAALQVLLRRLRRGPPLSGVVSVDSCWATPSGEFAEFAIRR